MKVKFDVQGMSCAACQTHVQKAVEKVDGVKNASVNLLSNSMIVEFDDGICDAQKICDAVSGAGYGATPLQPHIDKNRQKSTKKRDFALAKLITCVALLLILMYFSMGNMMWGFPAPNFLDHKHNPVGFALVQLVLVLPVLFIYRNYFASGYKKLFKGKPNMDTLIAVGATASVAYGLFALFMLSYAQSRISAGVNVDKWSATLTTYSGSLYFESAGMILTLVSLGKYLEGLSKKKTTAAITKLMDLAPKRATLLRDGEEVDIPAEDVRVGDILIVKNGASIPVDGVVVEGVASVNQANITGESIPIQKQAGDEVFSSTTLTAGYFKMQATKVGEDTSIAAIIRLVDEASNSKAPISRLADKISGVFVPIILAIAIVTLAANLIAGSPFELALNFAISVVVIACPCALGLATPVSIMAGTGKGAQNGLLIKNAEILEKAHLIKTVVLDKTGTITEGKPKVTDFVEFCHNQKTLSAIYSLERMSEHPLALAICEFASQKGADMLPVEGYRSIEGGGIEGNVEGVHYVIGNERLASDYCALSDNMRADALSLAKEGKTPLFVVADGAPAAILALKDTVKEGSAQAVAMLKARGIKVIMLTGDNPTAANVIAQEVGVDEVMANVRPQDKHNVIESLKSDAKHLVAMVGDGVNDAPALTAADIGIAIGGGSDVAMECSDIVLLRKDLTDVVNVIALSKRTLNTIKLGLFWAFFYNLVCVLIATGAFYYINPDFKINPMIGALAMSVSSVSVVLNALTINFFKGVKKGKKADAHIPDNKSDDPQNSTIIDNHNKSNNVQNSTNKENNMLTYTISVQGMMCNMCEKHVNSALAKLANVVNVTSSHTDGKTVVTSSAPLDENALTDAIVEAGYEVLAISKN